LATGTPPFQIIDVIVGLRAKNRTEQSTMMMMMMMLMMIIL